MLARASQSISRWRTRVKRGQEGRRGGKAGSKRGRKKRQLQLRCHAPSDTILQVRSVTLLFSSPRRASFRLAAPLHRAPHLSSFLLAGASFFSYFVHCETPILVAGQGARILVSLSPRERGDTHAHMLGPGPARPTGPPDSSPAPWQSPNGPTATVDTLPNFFGQRSTKIEIESAIASDRGLGDAPTWG